MEYIAHRKNTIKELNATSIEYGIEMDIRSVKDKLIVIHDPFLDGEDFKEWIRHYKHKTLILNIKEEGIEYRVKDIVEKEGIHDYFFLDLSFPYLIKMVNTGEKRVAVRFSEYESIDTVIILEGKAEWVWVDCFTKIPLDNISYKRLINAGFKLCLVSPELQGREEDLPVYKETILKNNWKFDAICTKHPDKWK